MEAQLHPSKVLDNAQSHIIVIQSVQGGNKGIAYIKKPQYDNRKKN